MTAHADLHRVAKYVFPARPRATARKRFATAALLASAIVAGVLGWRWALVAATTEDGPAPESVVTEPAAPPASRHAAPPIELEVTVLDVRAAAASAGGARAPRKATPSSAASRTAPAVKR